MPPCKHHEICGLDALEGEENCILHCRNPDKDKTAFYEALTEYRKEKGDCFDHFVFLEYADFANIRFTGDAYFWKVRFNKGVNFSDAHFTGKVGFNGASFSGRTLFDFSNGISVSTQIFI
jgi:hypothetical protein